MRVRAMIGCMTLLSLMLPLAGVGVAQTFTIFDPPNPGMGSPFDPEVSGLRRLGRLRTGTKEAIDVGTAPEEAPLVLQRVGLVVLLTFCLTLPSNWTQNIPERYGSRHAGLEYSWLYPDIDTSAPAGEP